MSLLLYPRESYLIRKAIYEIYKTFRSNHKEAVYHNALLQLLKEFGFTALKTPHIPVHFHGAIVGTYVPDIVINDIIVVEIKCKPLLHRDDIKQFWEYLKATEYKIGFLVNFGKPDGVEIIRRIYDKARK